jgi:murein DD-endopeptidase MepM/ murein hydrolase activator NlpD
LKIGLPFYGEWSISQGQNGAITHKNEYQYAWDFVIKDDDYKTFRLPGTSLEDYYCYALPILAPADGYVVNIIDGVDDNLIGDVNLQQNWGNTIIIKHSEQLYSKISHIKKDSFKVNMNDYVYKGQVLASNGSSGRSPEPHIHFQLQTTAVIAATTIKYPLSNYVTKINNQYVFSNCGIPNENDVVANAVINGLLKSAFHLIPGKKLNWDISIDQLKSTEKWEVFVDSNNHTYIYSYQTKAIAWFVNDGTKFYFTTFEGDKNSLLYYFYINAHKVIFSYYQDLVITDTLPIYEVFKPLNRLLNDFILPFTNTLKAQYQLTYSSIDDYLYPQNISLNSSISLKSIFTTNNNFNAEIKLSNGNIHSFEANFNGKNIIATCEVL